MGATQSVTNNQVRTSFLKSKYQGYFQALVKSSDKINTDEAFDKFMEALEDYQELYGTYFSNAEEVKKKAISQIDFECFVDDTIPIFDAMQKVFSLELSQIDETEKDYGEMIANFQPVIDACESLSKAFHQIKRDFEGIELDDLRQPLIDYSEQNSLVISKIKEDTELISSFFKKCASNLQEEIEAISDLSKTIDEETKSLLFTLKKKEKFDEIIKNIKEIDSYSKSTDTYNSKIVLQYEKQLLAMQNSIADLWCEECQRKPLKEHSDEELEQLYFTLRSLYTDEEVEANTFCSTPGVNFQEAKKYLLSFSKYQYKTLFQKSSNLHRMLVDAC